MKKQYNAAKPADDPLAPYIETLYGGNAGRGQSIFFEHVGAQCIRCHIVDEQGSDVGPDLTEVGSRLSRRRLLEALVDPNARLAPGFGVVTVILEDGDGRSRYSRG